MENMSEKPDNPEDPLEAQLRRWGADEAARQHAPPQPARWKLPRRSDPFATARWLAVAATIIVVVSVSLLVVRMMGQQPQPPTPETQAQIERLTRQLADTQLQADQAREDLAVAGKRLRQLQTASASQPAEQAAAVTAEIARLKEAMVDANDALARERAKVADLDAAVTGLRPRADRGDKLAKDLAQAGSKLTEANEQINALSSQRRQLVETEKKLGEDLAELRRQTSTLMADCQRVYVSVSSGEQSGWRGRKLAVKHNRLIERAAGLRATVHEESMRQLIDRAEVLLTRLEMLDTRDAGAVNAFTAMVESSKIGERIDLALAGSRLDAPARMWLLEARLVLTGADHVG